MKTIVDYLSFNKFMMPAALQFLFWSGIGGTLYGTWWLYSHDNWAWVMSLTFGTLITRLVFESFILKYRTYVCLRDIRETLNEKM